VPRLPAAAAATETAYSDMPMSMMESPRTNGSGKGTPTLRSNVNDSQRQKAEGSPWSIGKDGLLRYSDSVYVPGDAAIRNEILCVNRDE
jgi:hypothetical protein